jgi:hypothetical protein
MSKRLPLWQEICQRYGEPDPARVAAIQSAREEERAQVEAKRASQHAHMAIVLAEHPTIAAAELARIVGCSGETARKWKRRILQNSAS